MAEKMKWRVRSMGFIFTTAMMLTGVLPAGSATATNQFRFVMLSDVHVSPTLLPNHLSKYPTMVGEITNLAPRPAVVFVTGDLTEYSLETDYDSFITNFITPLTRAGIPVYPLPGNHEINGNTLAVWTRKLGTPLYQSVDIQQTHFILTCGVPEGINGEYGLKSDPSMTWGIGQAGQIDTNQLAWILADLASPAATQAQFTVMMDHFPLWNESGDGYELKNDDWWGNATGAGTTLRQACDTFGVDAFFFGHRHVQRTPSVHTFASGRQTLAVLNEATVYGKQETYTNALGVEKTGGVYGYDVYDVSGSHITHYRKTIDSYGGPFIGPKNVFTFPAITDLTLENQPVTGVRTSSATLSGNLVSCGSTNSASVTLFWGPDNQATNLLSWPNSIALGWRGVGACATTVTGLQANRTYYFRGYASNHTGTAWAPDTAAFTTLATPPPPPPADTNASGYYWDPNQTATPAYGGAGYWTNIAAWYNGIGSLTVSPFAATNDQDLDGMPAWAEYLAGTDPTNPHSRLRIDSIALEPDGMGIAGRGQSETGKFYRLERATHLMDSKPFNTVIRSNIPGFPPMNTETDRTAASRSPCSIESNWNKTFTYSPNKEQINTATC